MKTLNQIPELRNATRQERILIWKRARRNSPRFRRIYTAWCFAIFFSSICTSPLYKASFPHASMGFSYVLSFLTACIIGALGLYFIVYPELARALRLPERLQ